MIMTRRPWLAVVPALLALFIGVCGFAGDKFRSTFEYKPKIEHTVIGAYAKNRDVLYGYLDGKEDAYRELGEWKYPEYALSVEIYGYSGSRGECKMEFKTIEDLPKHSIPCPDWYGEKEGWIVYYEDDWIWNRLIRLRRGSKK